MKIVHLVSPLKPVDSRSNSAIYSHVGSLCDRLKAKKHEVSLFAASDSITQAELMSVISSSDFKATDNDPKLMNHYFHLLTSKCFNASVTSDIIHSHLSLISGFYSELSSVPLLVSFHSDLNEDSKKILRELKNVKYVSFSLAQRKQLPELNWYANIYHGVDTKLFSYNEELKGDYFLYLGRVTAVKGVHYAIQACMAAKQKLIIAGPTYEKEGYWQKEIEPYIDGVNIRYVGHKNLEDKIELLRNAKGLLFPTQTVEAFGYSMIEALSCGTPVIAWNNGSVPEIIKNKKTGFIVESLEEMCDAIKNIDTISRKDCRNRAELFFSVEKMVSGYEKIYKRIVDEEKFKKDKIQTVTPL